MDFETYAQVMQRIRQRKQNLERENVLETVQGEWQDDEFEASRYTHDWTCGQRSVTVDERMYLRENFFHSA